jgi:hypothetical protein
VGSIRPDGYTLQFNRPVSSRERRILTRSDRQKREMKSKRRAKSDEMKTSGNGVRSESSNR